MESSHAEKDSKAYSSEVATGTQAASVMPTQNATEYTEYRDLVEYFTGPRLKKLTRKLE
jgi:hypothetical protein